MHDSFPMLKMSYEQLSLLTAQLLAYQQYLQRKVAPSTKRNRTLRVLLPLLQRLQALFQPAGVQIGLLLTVEEVNIIKEALTILQQVLETKRPSGGRDQEIERLVSMYTLVNRTFSPPQDG
jgi:hypothetical protein